MENQKYKFIDYINDNIKDKNITYVFGHNGSGKTQLTKHIILNKEIDEYKRNNFIIINGNQTFEDNNKRIDKNSVKLTKISEHFNKFYNENNTKIDFSLYNKSAIGSQINNLVSTSTNVNELKSDVLNLEKLKIKLNEIIIFSNNISEDLDNKIDEFINNLSIEHVSSISDANLKNIIKMSEKMHEEYEDNIEIYKVHKILEDSEKKLKNINDEKLPKNISHNIETILEEIKNILLSVNIVNKVGINKYWFIFIDFIINNKESIETYLAKMNPQKKIDYDDYKKFFSDIFLYYKIYNKELETINKHINNLEWVIVSNNTLVEQINSFNIKYGKLLKINKYSFEVSIKDINDLILTPIVKVKKEDKLFNKELSTGERNIKSFISNIFNIHWNLLKKITNIVILDDIFDSNDLENIDIFYTIFNNYLSKNRLSIHIIVLSHYLESLLLMNNSRDANLYELIYTNNDYFLSLRNKDNVELKDIKLYIGKLSKDIQKNEFNKYMKEINTDSQNYLNKLVQVLESIISNDYANILRHRYVWIDYELQISEIYSYFSWESIKLIQNRTIRKILMFWKLRMLIEEHFIGNNIESEFIETKEDNDSTDKKITYHFPNTSKILNSVDNEEKKAIFKILVNPILHGHINLNLINSIKFESIEKYYNFIFNMEK